MAKIRVVKNSNYTVLSNLHLRDKRLSLKAKGLMTVMMSLPEEWDFSVKGLQTLGVDGRDGISTALAELEKCGYLVREQSREKGRFSGYDYSLYEEPQAAGGEEIEEIPPFTENPKTEKPITEKPFTENPKTVPPTPRVKEYNIINQILNNGNERRAPAHTHTREESEPDKAERKTFKPPTLDEVRAYIAERGSAVDANAWYDHYESNGWMVGRTRMKNWKAAVRTWERNGVSRGSPSPTKQPKDTARPQSEWDEFFKIAIEHGINALENQELEEHGGY